METRPTITLKNRKTGERGRYRMDQDRILVGRDRSCFIELKSKVVSRRHTEITREGDNFFVQGLKNKNQTYLNEVPLVAHEKTVLKTGDMIRIGHHELRFLMLPVGSAEELYEVTDSNILEVKMVKKLLKALDRENNPSLEIIEGPLSGKKFILEGKSQEIRVGRDLACEFRIDSEIVSRKHAKISRKFDDVRIQDLGSRNGVYVGKDRVGERVLKDGDRIHLGTITLMFRNPLETAKDFLPIEEPAPRKKPVPEKTPTPKTDKNASTSRAVVKAEDSLPEEVPSEPASDEAPFPSQASRAPVKASWSFSEVLVALVGVLVLVGAIWAIWKIL